VGVLGWDDAEASVVGEVTVHGYDFYEYRAKYDGSTQLSIPADIPSAVARQMQELAVQAFHALDCAGLARVDFFWERRSHRVFLNEINTLPGMTPYSMYPVLWEATGVSYPQLIDRLIQMALERHQ
jgi:D-alanine-D-alanine ligase